LLLLAPLLLQPLPQALNRWDVVHYLALAQHGAQGNLQAFFPLWPALIAWLFSATATISSNAFLWAGFGLANFAFLIALGLMHQQALRLWGVIVPPAGRCFWLASIPLAYLPLFPTQKPSIYC